jgi:hypothetical protein
MWEKEGETRLSVWTGKLAVEKQKTSDLQRGKQLWEKKDEVLGKCLKTMSQQRIQVQRFHVIT